MLLVLFNLLFGNDVGANDDRLVQVTAVYDNFVLLMMIGLAILMMLVLMMLD